MCTPGGGAPLQPSLLPLLPTPTRELSSRDESAKLIRRLYFSSFADGLTHPLAVALRLDPSASVSASCDARSCIVDSAKGSLSRVSGGGPEAAHWIASSIVSEGSN